jgi:hypothetical protein
VGTDVPPPPDPDPARSRSLHPGRRAGRDRGRHHRLVARRDFALTASTVDDGRRTPVPSAASEVTRGGPSTQPAPPGPAVPRARRLASQSGEGSRPHGRHRGWRGLAGRVLSGRGGEPD